ncbi:hypothetical protein GQ55_5G428000 [Panicum hallii var. hallii]|uniref:Uncharacterized protein n=1 Tax=Panicum hallii var. hallii TaxID=1504633 RepID=A0A2T7DPA5_9POAL|nr:hypothetical protein GQ55_5G428000 [Panicum hallii var. hallii]
MCRVTKFPSPIIAACPLQKNPQMIAKHSSISFPELQAIQFAHRPSSLQKWHPYKEPAHLCPPPLPFPAAPLSSSAVAASSASSAMADRSARPRPNIRLGDYGAAKDDLPIDGRTPPISSSSDH